MKYFKRLKLEVNIIDNELISESCQTLKIIKKINNGKYRLYSIMYGQFFF